MNFSTVSQPATASLPTLTRQEDFRIWNTMLRHILSERKLEKYLDESVPQPPMIPSANSATYTRESLDAVETWASHRRYVLQLILQTTFPVRDHLEQFGFRFEETDPHVLYQTVEAAFGTLNTITLNGYFAQFINIRVSQFVSPADFVREFSKIVRALDGTGFQLTDLCKSNMFLLQLAPLNEPFIAQLQMQVEANELSYTDVLRQVSRRFAAPSHSNAHLPTGLAMSSITDSSRRNFKDLPKRWTYLPFVDRQKAFKESFPYSPQCTMCRCQHKANYLWCSSCQLCHPGGEKNCYRSSPPDREGNGQHSPHSIAQSQAVVPRASPNIERFDTGINAVSLSFLSLAVEDEPTSPILEADFSVAEAEQPFSCAETKLMPGVTDDMDWFLKPSSCDAQCDLASQLLAPTGQSKGESQHSKESPTVFQTPDLSTDLTLPDPPLLLHASSIFSPVPYPAVFNSRWLLICLVSLVFAMFCGSLGLRGSVGTYFPHSHSSRESWYEICSSTFCS